MAKATRQSLGLTGTEGLSESQKKIYDFIKSQGKVTREDVMESLRLPPHEMETQLAILRHCELIRGRKENGKIYLMPFEHDEGQE